jgi:hypothetical protein
MSTSKRPPARAPIIGRTTTGWAGTARRAFAASTRAGAWRVTWLTGAAAATSLVAACGSASPSQPDTSPVATLTVTASAPSGAPAPATQPPGTDPPGIPTGVPSTSPPRNPATSPSKPAPSAGTGGGTGGGPGLAGCRTATLHIAVDATQAQGAAGSAFYPLNFTNASGTACEMYGYPGVSFAASATGAGQQIGAAAERNGAFTKVPVRLAPGQTAHAWLKVTAAGNYPAATCRPVTAHWLRIYPPGEAAAGYVGHTFSACASMRTALLSVLPVRAGQGVAGVTP